MRSRSLKPAASIGLCTVALATLVSALGCPSYTAIAEHQRVDLQKEHAGEIRWLKQSMYAGTFYDDDRYELVSAIPFEQVTVLRTLDGEVVTPPPADEILPAGTKVRIERIGFPTGREVFRRPLYTPRYTTWIVMRVAASRGETQLERDKKHILLMPTFLKDDTEFDTWLDASLSAEDPNPWLRSLAPNVREGIFNKQPALGMSYDALTAAMGYPDRITRTPKTVVRNGRTIGVTLEVAIFGAASVVLEDGVVIRVSDPATGLSLESKPAPVQSHPPAATSTKAEPSAEVPSKESPPSPGEEADQQPNQAEVPPGNPTESPASSDVGGAGAEDTNQGATEEAIEEVVEDTAEAPAVPGTPATEDSAAVPPATSQGEEDGAAAPPPGDL